MMFYRINIIFRDCEPMFSRSRALGTFLNNQMFSGYRAVSTFQKNDPCRNLLNLLHTSALSTTAKPFAATTNLIVVASLNTDARQMHHDRRPSA
jgi:hypothetical protein